MLISTVLIPLLFFLELHYNKDPKILYLIPASAVYGLIIWIINNKINTIQIYTYSYETLFPLKVFQSPYSKNNNHKGAYSIQSKVYIIDDKVAHLGSLNFTVSGFETNFETRIRITDSDAIRGITNLFSELFHSNDNPSIKTEQFAQRIYTEPIN
jgi:phosphatidylserine/phosphatidylglycerophosphate/cardiolipin synthase-like enzyme